jgi:hypothetical protein
MSFPQGLGKGGGTKTDNHRMRCLIQMSNSVLLFFSRANTVVPSVKNNNKRFVHSFIHSFPALYSYGRVSWADCDHSAFCDRPHLPGGAHLFRPPRSALQDGAHRHQHVLPGAARGSRASGPAHLNISGNNQGQPTAVFQVTIRASPPQYSR